MIEATLQLNKSDFKLEANFSVPGRGVTAIFGPSGCGKTTLLRAIAGLEPATKGSLSVNAEQWLDANGSRAAEERRVGVVFQNPSLFPHLTIQENLLYGRKRLRKVTKTIVKYSGSSEICISKDFKRYEISMKSNKSQCKVQRIQRIWYEK